MLLLLHNSIKAFFSIVLGCDLFFRQACQMEGIVKKSNKQSTFSHTHFISKVQSQNELFDELRKT